MRYFLISLFTVFVMMFVTVPVVTAQNVFNDACKTAPQSALCREVSGQNSSNQNSIYGPNGIINRIARFIAVITGIASVIMIMIGGFKYIMASGDSTNIQSAKNTILFAVIGLIIAASTQAIVIFVLNRI